MPFPPFDRSDVSFVPYDAESGARQVARVVRSHSESQGENEEEDEKQADMFSGWKIGDGCGKTACDGSLNGFCTRLGNKFPMKDYVHAAQDQSANSVRCPPLADWRNARQAGDVERGRIRDPFNGPLPLEKSVSTHQSLMIAPNPRSGDAEGY